MENEKKRTSNFTEIEKNSLIEICTSYPEIEDQSFDNLSLIKKRETWTKILNEFISIHGGSRSVKNLQGLWKRLKMQGKEEVDKRRMHARRTGGGTPLPPLEKKYEHIASFLGPDTGPIENSLDPPSPIQVRLEDMETDCNYDEMDDYSNTGYTGILNSTPHIISKEKNHGSRIIFCSKVNDDDVDQTVDATQRLHADRNEPSTSSSNSTRPLNVDRYDCSESTSTSNMTKTFKVKRVTQDRKNNSLYNKNNDKRSKTRKEWSKAMAIHTEKILNEERQLNCNVDSSQTSSRGGKPSLYDLQIKTMELALKNEEEKLELRRKKKSLIETKQRCAEKKLAFYTYKALMAQKEYEENT